MAMLAEPRRKQKIINLRAKNNAWSNDNTKFGQRMLEKMGWQSGKGLGANENGITEHVVARYKNDEKGLGFEDKNDQWTKHEDDFNSLLANLSNASDTENLHSGVSLEDKSKKSKARIHYHKFTRGKDISRYSEKDLANIFGKKCFKNNVVEEKEKEENVKEDLKTEQVFTDKGSMEDYFKKKLAVIKSKSKVDIPIVKDDDMEDHSYGFQGFSQDTNNTELDSVDNEVLSTHIENSYLNNFVSNSEKVKKKNKSKKDKAEMTEDNNSEHFQQLNSENNEDEEIPECNTVKKIKKKKKSKTKLNGINGLESNENSNGLENLENATNTDQIVKEKKKSKEKYLNCDSSQSPLIRDNDNVSQETSHKKKKRLKYNKEQNTNDLPCIQEDINRVHKKSKKRNEQCVENVEKHLEEPKKKKKKKQK